MEVPYKTTNRISIWPSNSISGHISWENHNSERHIYPNVHLEQSGDRSNLNMHQQRPGQRRWVHIYNGTLLSHRKWNCATCRDKDGRRVCHTAWSKKEREKQMSWINTHIWNLGEWYRWTYFQSRNTHADVESKHSINQLHEIASFLKKDLWILPTPNLSWVAKSQKHCTREGFWNYPQSKTIFLNVADDWYFYKTHFKLSTEIKLSCN